MYSMFDPFFNAPSYMSIYVISHSEIKELQQAELDGIINQKKRLEEAYKAQVKHLERRKK